MLAVGARNPREERQERAASKIDKVELKARISGIVSRWPAVGLAVGVVHDGRLEFYGHGVADIGSGTPITADTVFRIASITKLFTAVAVMQLWEQGLIDLDRPANDYLRAFRLIAAKPSFRPATVRHLLTHTAGLPDVLHVRDLFHPGWGKFDARPAVYSVKLGEKVPSLTEYYGPGPRVDVDPGTAFAYSNHGFAVLGQIVEDVSAQPLHSYFRQHIFEPLGMMDSSLVLTDGMKSRKATGYDLGASGAEAVIDREWITGGASNVYSTTRDMGRFVAALAGGGTNERGSILKPATLASMFDPHYEPDPRLAGMGLGFFRNDASGHRVVGHEGRLPGFNSQLLVAPDDGVGIVAFTNGSSRAMFWLPTELGRLLGILVGASEDAIRSEIPQHPEIWDDICGLYRAPVIDLRGRLMMGGGVEVFVRGGRLMVRLQTPLPALYRGVELHPEDETDPYVFRIELPQFGMGTARVVFSRAAGTGKATAVHTDMGLLSFQKRPHQKDPRQLLARSVPALLFPATVVALRRLRSSRAASTGDEAQGSG
jgi:CubicO group peptidase (beta-lactamase class C family)